MLPGYKANSPTILVIVGATGDLMTRKILPSLYRLFQEQRLPSMIRIIGFARRPLSNDDYRSFLKKALVAAGKQAPAVFLQLFHYHAGDFRAADDFVRLNQALAATDAEWSVCTNKLFYLAVPPQWYESIFKHLAGVKLNLPCGGELGWTRLLIEKPFGNDLASSRALEQLLKRYFKEGQLYRLDHYLAKELLQGIVHFRFSNNLLERSWDNTTIEKIEVRLLETIGVEDRGAFYDSVGALRDVGQNHVLEMLAAVTMEYPADLHAAALHARRAEILRTLRPWTATALKQHTYRAQYEGYRSITGVRPNSATETYFKLATELTHPSWTGVPITLEAGKRCPQARKEIVVIFKHPPMCLWCTPKHHAQNTVVFSLEPNDQIIIRFWTKKPGFEKALEERAFTFFVHEKTDKAEYVEEYAKLLVAAMEGDQSLFAGSAEVDAMWQFADPILKAWRANLVPLETYQPGSDTMLQRSQWVEPVQQPVSEIIPREIGIIGLGKMGANLAQRLMEHGWNVTGYNRTPEATKALAREGITPAYSLEAVVNQLSKPRLIWLMVPAGTAVDDVLFGANGLIHYLKRGDIIIDGGNSYYQDTIRRARQLQKHGIHLVDVGVSGGPDGARHGACLMIGGTKALFKKLEALYHDCAVAGGYQFFEGAGAGHFVKMVHNGIEYGMMQAIAEGFTVLKNARYQLDLARVADVYNHGSVIDSRLIGWLKKALELHGEDLKRVSGTVEHTGEGAWTVQTSKALQVKIKVIEEALKFRIASKRTPSYTGKLLTALRNQFGGHAIR